MPPYSANISSHFRDRAKAVKKNEAETKIRYLCGQWAEHKGLPAGGMSNPSFMEFYNWTQFQGYGSVFNFRSTEGAMAQASQWFDEEFKQTWRN